MRTSTTLVMIISLLMGGYLILSPAPALATTITVTTTTDELNSDGDCSLREAIRAANWDVSVDGCQAGSDGDTIVLAGGVYQLTQVGIGENAGLSGDFDITSNLSIVGADAPSTIIDGIARDRVFEIFPNTTATLAHIAVQNGAIPAGGGGGGGIRNLGSLTLDHSIVSSNRVEGGRPSGHGGGIWNTDGTVTVRNSIVAGNVAAATGDSCEDSGGEGGGIWNRRGTLTVIDSTIRDNRAEGVAEDCVTEGGFGGGIKDSGGRVHIINSTLANNSGGSFGGVAGGLYTYRGTVTIDRSIITENRGGIYNQGTMTITDSRISGNEAATGKGGARGGGVYSDYQLALRRSVVANNTAKEGGGIYAKGTATIENSTISGNTALGDPAYFGGDGGGITADGAVSLTSSTVVDNRANFIEGELDELGHGGGIWHISGSVTLRNTIVANNTATDGKTPDCSGTVTSEGYNLIALVGGCTITGVTADVIVGVDPRLDALEDNGGPTFTHEPLEGSPVIDAGTNVDCPATDQRGVKRPQDGNSDGNNRCDLGAHEFNRAAPLLTTPTPTPSGPSNPYIERIFVPLVNR